MVSYYTSLHVHDYCPDKKNTIQILLVIKKKMGTSLESESENSNWHTTNLLDNSGGFLEEFKSDHKNISFEILAPLALSMQETFKS
jgi:hypothetical protein